MAGRWRRRLRRRRRIGAGKTWRGFAWSGCRSGPRRTSRAANAGLATAVDGRQFMVAGPCGWGAETRVLGDGEVDSRRYTRRGSADAGAGETLADTRVVVVFLGWGLHQLIIDA